MRNLIFIFIATFCFAGCAATNKSLPGNAPQEGSAAKWEDLFDSKDWSPVNQTKQEEGKVL